MIVSKSAYKRTLRPPHRGGTTTPAARGSPPSFPPPRHRRSAPPEAGGRKDGGGEAFCRSHLAMVTLSRSFFVVVVALYSGGCSGGTMVRSGRPVAAWLDLDDIWSGAGRCLGVCASSWWCAGGRSCAGWHSGLDNGGLVARSSSMVVESGCPEVRSRQRLVRDWLAGLGGSLAGGQARHGGRLAA